MDEKITEDAITFGSNRWIYCNQHLRPHMTGWCTVSPRNKLPLAATTAEDAYTECRANGYKIFDDIIQGAT